MKKFFTELMEVVSAVALSSFIIYSVFTKIIGTPKDIKSIESNVATTKNKVDTVYQKVDTVSQKVDLMIGGINEIESTQVDVSQRLYDNNYLIKQNSEQLEKIENLIKDINKTAPLSN
jgi:peptidoglycan hydrolase CwlO-like protein